MPYTQATLFRACSNRDAARRARKEAAKPILVQWLKKNGEPSKMRDAEHRFETGEAAMQMIGYWRGANTKPLRFWLNGVEV